MRILYAITLAEKGGGQVHVADLLRAFAGREQVFLAVGEEGYLTRVARELNVSVFIVPHLVQPIRPVSDLLAVTELVKVIRLVEPDLIHAHTSKAGLLARIAGRIRKIPVVFTAHTWSFADGISGVQRYVSIPMERIAASWGGTIINVSEANRNLAIQHRVGAAEQLTTVWNGLPDCNEPVRTAENAVPQIVMVARFVSQKDQELLVRAAATLKLPYSLTFIGGGPTLESVRQLTSSCGLSQRVRFLGESNDVPKELASSDIFVLAAKWEGLPLSILEAMRAGLPVVASEVGGVAEAVVDGQTGYLVDRGDAEMLADRLVDLLADSVLRRNMGSAGRARYESHFTFDRMIAATDTVYRKAVRFAAV